MGLLVAVVSVFGDDKKSAKEETKKAVEPAAADKKQDKRGIFGEGYGHDFGGHDFGHHDFGGHEISLGHDFHGHDFGGHDFGGDHGHHGHHEHHEKTVTVVKKVPVPYPVEKQIHVPVEKVKHYPVHVHVPKPYPVEKIVHYTVKDIVKVPVHVPQPYPVEKIKHVPVHVHVDNPVPVKVYVPQVRTHDKRILRSYINPKLFYNVALSSRENRPLSSEGACSR